MGIFKNLLSSGAGGDEVAASGSDLDELAPLRSPYAAAEAAIDDAVRRRNGLAPRDAGALQERRDAENPDRRAGSAPTLLAGDSSRRIGPMDRRSSPPGFGKRGL